MLHCLQFHLVLRPFASSNFWDWVDAVGGSDGCTSVLKENSLVAEEVEGAAAFTGEFVRSSCCWRFDPSSSKSLDLGEDDALLSKGDICVVMREHGANDDAICSKKGLVVVVANLQ